MYRQGVAAIIINKQGKILVAQRKDDPTHYQFPQGGVHDGETEEEALFRELEEEIGTKSVRILRKSKIKTRYTWKGKYRKILPAVYGANHIGQEHRFFLCEFMGDEQEIHVDHREFHSFQWIDREDLLSKTATIRKRTYEKALKDLDY